MKTEAERHLDKAGEALEMARKVAPNVGVVDSSKALTSQAHATIAIAEALIALAKK